MDDTRLAALFGGRRSSSGDSSDSCSGAAVASAYRSSEAEQAEPPHVSPPRSALRHRPVAAPGSDSEDEVLAASQPRWASPINGARAAPRDQHRNASPQHGRQAAECGTLGWAAGVFHSSSSEGSGSSARQHVTHAASACASSAASSEELGDGAGTPQWLRWARTLAGASSSSSSVEAAAPHEGPASAAGLCGHLPPAQPEPASDCSPSPARGAKRLERELCSGTRRPPRRSLGGELASAATPTPNLLAAPSSPSSWRIPAHQAAAAAFGTSTGSQAWRSVLQGQQGKVEAVAAAGMPAAHELSFSFARHAKPAGWPGLPAPAGAGPVQRPSLWRRLLCLHAPPVKA